MDLPTFGDVTATLQLAAAPASSCFTIQTTSDPIKLPPLLADTNCKFGPNLARMLMFFVADRSLLVSSMARDCDVPAVSPLGQVRCRVSGTRIGSGTASRSFELAGAVGEELPAAAVGGGAPLVADWPVESEEPAGFGGWALVPDAGALPL